MSMDKLIQFYMNNIVRLHGTPISIVYDRDARFTGRVCKEFQEAMSIELKLVLHFIFREMDNQKRLSKY